MKNILSSFKFKGKWRSYQQRVLEELVMHFSDKRLHVVAAPGAGKTTLGIEVIRRLGNPTLILCLKDVFVKYLFDNDAFM